jgi:hypothetical protein
VLSPPADTGNVVRAGVTKACKAFSTRLSSRGFERTKPMLWTRRHLATVDFIHLHRSGSSYGAPINYSVTLDVECGIRVLADTFLALVPNGPASSHGSGLAARYHLRFNAQTWSTFDRCVDDLEQFVIDRGEPWFLQFRTPEALLTRSDSPLRDEAKHLLRAALSGTSPANEAALSLRLLGIRAP